MFKIRSAERYWSTVLYLPERYLETNSRDQHTKGHLSEVVAVLDLVFLRGLPKQTLFDATNAEATLRCIL